MKQGALFILIVVFLPVNALPPNLRRQADPNDPCLDEALTLDDPTVTIPPGLELNSNLLVWFSAV